MSKNVTAIMAKNFFNERASINILLPKIFPIKKHPSEEMSFACQREPSEMTDPRRRKRTPYPRRVYVMKNRQVSWLMIIISRHLPVCEANSGITPGNSHSQWRDRVGFSPNFPFNDFPPVPRQGNQPIFLTIQLTLSPS
jgi:hypothetical protein